MIYAKDARRRAARPDDRRPAGRAARRGHRRSLRRGLQGDARAQHRRSRSGSARRRSARAPSPASPPASRWPGYRPIAEIMFGDFLTLCFDQVVNHIAKYGAMYDGGASCPVIIRTPSGGDRGVRPDAQPEPREALPGRAAPARRGGARCSTTRGPSSVTCSSGDTPALYIEHKLLYPHGDRRRRHPRRPSGAVDRRPADGRAVAPSIARTAPPRSSPTATRPSSRAACSSDWRSRRSSSPSCWSRRRSRRWTGRRSRRSAAVTGSLLTVEEGTTGWSWGTEVAAVMGRRLFGRLRRPVEVLASRSERDPGRARARGRGPRRRASQIEAAIREAVR